MRHPKLIALVLTLCAVIAGGLALHHLYERHLSSDCRRIMIAADDGHESLNEQTRYIHDARLAIKTDKDAEVLRDLEEASSLLANANETSSKLESKLDILQETYRSEWEIFTLARQSPSTDQVRLNRDIEEHKADYLKRISDLKAESHEAEEQMHQAVILYTRVAKELGTPYAFIPKMPDLHATMASKVTPR